MNDKIENKGALTPDKLLQDAESKLKQEALNGIKSELAKKVKTKADAKKVYLNATRDLEDFLASATQDIKDLEENV